MQVWPENQYVYSNSQEISFLTLNRPRIDTHSNLCAIVVNLVFLSMLFYICNTPSVGVAKKRVYKPTTILPNRH